MMLNRSTQWVSDQASEGHTVPLLPQLHLQLLDLAGQPFALFRVDAKALTQIHLLSEQVVVQLVGYGDGHLLLQCVNLDGLSLHLDLILHLLSLYPSDFALGFPLQVYHGIEAPLQVLALVDMPEGLFAFPLTLASVEDLGRVESLGQAIVRSLVYADRPFILESSPAQRCRAEA